MIHDDPIAQLWLDHMLNESTPRNTMRARLRVLRSVANPGTATREEIERWWLTRAGKAPATRANDLACLRSFYKWAAIWEHRADDPTIRLQSPKVPKGTPRPVSSSGLRAAFAWNLHPEDRRAIALGAYAGLRISEAASLMWDDVDVESRRAHVTGKGDKTRPGTLSTALLDLLLPVKPGCNVVTGTDRVYTADTLDRRCNRALRESGAGGTFHQLRHRYGTAAYRSTRDLRAVQKIMGHASVATTQVYADAADEVADQIADAVMD